MLQVVSSSKPTEINDYPHKQAWIFVTQDYKEKKGRHLTKQW
jgi:glycine cleavage system H lipoate-binding protein